MTLNVQHILSDFGDAGTGSMLTGSFSGGEQRESLAEVAAFFQRASAAQGGARPSKPYRSVAVVRGAVGKKANCLASMTAIVMRGDDQIVENGPLVDLLDQPNERMSGRDFWKTSSAWLDLTGAVHWILDRGGMRVPRRIIPVGAWQMKPILDRTKQLIGWKYRAAGRRWDEAVELTLDDVWTVGEDSFDPDDPFGFSSPLEAAGLAVSQVYKADLANEASLDRGVEPGGVLTMPGQPTRQQIADVREEITARHAGVQNRRSLMLLYGGMDWKQVAATFDDMEFSTLQRMKIKDVCVALEVDPAAIGYAGDEGLGSGKEKETAQASLWIDAVLPRSMWLADEFNRGVTSLFEGRAHAGRRTSPVTRAIRATPNYRHAMRRAASSGDSGLSVMLDSSGVPAVRDAMLARSREGAIWIEKYGATPNDVIEALGLPIPGDHPWQQTWFKPIGLIDVQQDMSELGDTDGTVSQEESELLGGGAKPNQDAQPQDGTNDDEDSGAVEQHIRALTDAQLARLQEQWRSTWKPLELAMLNRVRRWMMALRAATLKRLREDTGDAAASPDTRTRALADRVLFDIVVEKGKLLTIAGPIIDEAFRLGGQQVMDEAAAAQDPAPGTPATPDTAQPFSITDPNVTAAIRARKQRLSGIADTLARKLRASIEQAASNQETVSQIAERIRHEFNIAVTKANTIARTEVGGAMEQARQQARTQANVPAKSWLWSRAEKGRASHAATERDTLKHPIAADADFTIAGTSITCPHPRATGLPEHDINCGCTTINRYPGDKVADAASIARLFERGFTTLAQLAERDAAKGFAR